MKGDTVQTFRCPSCAQMLTYRVTLGPPLMTPEGVEATVTLDHDALMTHIRECAESDAEGVTHACPPDGSGVMPCCGRTPFEVSRRDRMTLDQDLVTCIQRRDR
jgi:hypothetical protein